MPATITDRVCKSTIAPGPKVVMTWLGRTSPIARVVTVRRLLLRGRRPQSVPPPEETHKSATRLRLESSPFRAAPCCCLEDDESHPTSNSGARRRRGAPSRRGAKATVIERVQRCPFPLGGQPVDKFLRRCRW